jgi:hypothetical protein
VTAVVLPLSVVALDGRPDYDLRDAMVGYYNARGEQILNFNQQPAGYTVYLQLTPEEKAAGRAEGDKGELASRLIKQNARDLANMLLSVDRRPALTHFWNRSGRYYPMLLVPFFLLGMLQTLWRAPRRLESRVLLVLFWGFSLPLLLTSRVDIGRMIFALPLLFLYVAIGFGWTAARAVAAGEWLVRRFHRDRLLSPARFLAPALLTALLLAAVARSTWWDYGVDVTPPREEPEIAMLAQASMEASRRGGAVLVRGGTSQLEGEAISTAVLRLSLEGHYDFVNLAHPADSESSVDGDTPALYFGGVLDLIDEPAKIPGICENVYFVAPEAMERFAGMTSGTPDGCAGSLLTYPLPRP